MYAVELSRTAPSGATNERLDQAGIELDQITQDQQLQVLEYLVSRKGLSIGAITLLEGVNAMRDQHPTKPSATGGAAPGGIPPQVAAGASGPASATSTAPPPVNPGS
ncbi:MAG TPA: hypothetical protein VHN14_01850 [Kofleriaceae bacterium]|nr:hypothetical protein [Kofleriaceae bacterium]